jgi:hypothetical protein
MGSWVAGEVLVGAELGGVYENGSDHCVALTFSQPDQAQVPLMQRAHRRHQT